MLHLKYLNPINIAVNVYYFILFHFILAVWFILFYIFLSKLTYYLKNHLM